RLRVALVLVHAVHSWPEKALEKFYLRERSDHRTLLRRMSGEVLTMLDLRSLADAVVETLREGVSARTTVLLIAPGARDPVARGFGGRVDLEAIASIPRASLDRFTEGLSMVRQEEMRDLGAERNENGGLDPLRTTDAYLVLPLRHAGQFLGLISLGRTITETRSP